MAYRFLVVMCVVSFFCGCSAFDNGNAPFEGWSNAEVPGGITKTAFTGNMTADTNECDKISQSVAIAGDVGVPVSLSFELDQDKVNPKNIRIKFADGTFGSDTMDAKNGVIVMHKDEKHGVNQFYYLTISDTKIEGTCEVVVKDADGQFGKPCATYKIDLHKGDAVADAKKPS